MKKLILSFSILTTIVAFAACKKSSNSTPTTAGVMFVNGCAGATAVNATANSAAVNEATAISFLKNSGYQSITAAAGENMAFSISASGLTTPLISGSVDLTAGNHYSVYAGGIFTRPLFVSAPDDLTSPSAGFAKVRFVNLCSDTLNESCFIGSQKVDSNVAYASITPFFQISPTTNATILFQDPGSPTKLAQLSNQSISSGRIYTIMITGTSSAATGSSSALTLTIINNN